MEILLLYIPDKSCGKTLPSLTVLTFIESNDVKHSNFCEYCVLMHNKITVIATCLTIALQLIFNTNINKVYQMINSYYPFVLSISLGDVKFRCINDEL